MQDTGQRGIGHGQHVGCAPTCRGQGPGYRVQGAEYRPAGYRSRPTRGVSKFRGQTTGRGIGHRVQVTGQRGIGCRGRGIGCRGRGIGYKAGV